MLQSHQRFYGPSPRKGVARLWTLVPGCINLGTCRRSLSLYLDGWSGCWDTKSGSGMNSLGLLGWSNIHGSCHIPLAGFSMAMKQYTSFSLVQWYWYPYRSWWPCRWRAHTLNKRWLDVCFWCHHLGYVWLTNQMHLVRKWNRPWHLSWRMAWSASIYHSWCVLVSR